MFAFSPARHKAIARLLAVELDDMQQTHGITDEERVLCAFALVLGEAGRQKLSTAHLVTMFTAVLQNHQERTREQRRAAKAG